MAEVQELDWITRMSNDLTRSKQSGAGLTTGSESQGLLHRAFQDLSPEDQRKFQAKATELALQQEVANLDAKRRFEASGAEMHRHVDLVKEHEKIKSDFTIHSEFETASGKTTVKVSKANNTLYIVIAVVIAVVFFVMFSR